MGVGNIAKTGLKAALSNMETISNNIANVNSIGFKKSFINFSDIYMTSANGASNKQLGLGARVNSVRQDFSLGRIESSTRSLDLTIGSDGFFVQKNPGTGLVSYTRAGRMDFDSNGYLIGYNGRVQGYPAVNGAIASSGTLVDLQVPTSAIPAKATSSVNLSVNLNSSEEAIAAPFNMTDPSTYNYRTDETIYDSLGNSYLMTLYYIKTADNTWSTQVGIDNNIMGTGNLLFTDQGQLSNATGLNGLAWNPGNGAAPGTLDINFAHSTQLAGKNQNNNHNQNGCTSGYPLGCVIDNNGNMNVSYSNGKSQIQGQIAIANFMSPQGLSQSENMSWLPTTDSGTPIFDPQTNQGNIVSNSIEYSNVDLTEELVNLISAQHDFQANAQVQQTYNQVLQTIENI